MSRVETNGYIFILGHALHFFFSFGVKSLLCLCVLHFLHLVFGVFCFFWGKKIGCYCDTSTSCFCINPQLALMSRHHTFVIILCILCMRIDSLDRLCFMCINSVSSVTMYLFIYALHNFHKLEFDRMNEFLVGNHVRKLD